MGILARLLAGLRLWVAVLTSSCRGEGQVGSMLWVRATLAVVWDHEGCYHLSWAVASLSSDCTPLCPLMVSIPLGHFRPSGEV